MANKALTVSDEDLGKTASFPLYEGTLGHPTLDIQALNKEHGCFTFDPGFASTASCKSSITFIDGDKGFSSIAGTRSTNLQNTAVSSRSLIC